MGDAERVVMIGATTGLVVMIAVAVIAAVMDAVARMRRKPVMVAVQVDRALAERIKRGEVASFSIGSQTDSQRIARRIVYGQPVARTFVPTPLACRVVSGSTVRVLGCARCQPDKLCNPLEATSADVDALERLSSEVRAS